MSQVSAELDALTCDLIGEAVSTLEAEGKLPVLLMSDAEQEFLAFEDDDADGCYRAACQQVQDYKASCNMYAIAYEGIIQESEEDAGMPAIIFEFAQRGESTAWSGYVLYRRNKNGEVEVSDPFPGGEEQILFA